MAIDFRAVRAHERERARKERANGARTPAADAEEGSSASPAAASAGGDGPATMTGGEGNDAARLDEIRANLAGVLTPRDDDDDGGDQGGRGGGGEGGPFEFELRYSDDFLTRTEADFILRALHRPPNGCCSSSSSSSSSKSLSSSSSEWLQLPKRRLLNLGGIPHPDGLIAEELPDWLRSVVLDRLGMVLPRDDEGWRPDQALVNEYEGGDGIDPHNDGPLFEPIVAIVSLGGSEALLRFLPMEEPHPPAAATSSAETTVGATATAAAKGAESEAEAEWAERGHAPSTRSLLLRPNSVAVFSGAAYDRYLHGIVSTTTEEWTEGHTLNVVPPVREAGCKADDNHGPAVRHRVRRDGGTRTSITIRAVRRVSHAAGEYVDDETAREAARRRAWWAGAVSEKESY